MAMTREHWKAVIFIAIAIAFVIVAWMLAGALDAQAPPQYKTTETQHLRLQVKQRDAWLAQRDAIEAQRRYQQAVGELNALGEEIRKENGWPETVIFDADRIEYTEPPRGAQRPGAPTQTPRPLPPLPEGITVK